jgi:asparagine synthase (glutamine-hydrolysing)
MGAGLHSDPHCILAHRRLSIVDLAGGHQPLSNEDENVWITYNGEIYNHTDLRRLLEGHGHRYHTKSDTETIVHGYEEWGAACVQRFRGMFAFAVWDARVRRLLLVRDRLGVKPLYWTRVGDRLLFASEIKSILASGLVAAEPNEAVIPEVLATRSTSGAETLFRGIFKLLPGHRSFSKTASCTSSSTGICRSTALTRPSKKPTTSTSSPSSAPGCRNPCISD